MSALSDFIAGTPRKWVTGTTYLEGKVVWSPYDYQYYMRKTTGAGSIDPASDTTNWQPTGDRAIKSIQRGMASAGPITISAVVMAKSELRFMGGYSFTSGVFDGVPVLQLTGTTQITVQGFGGASRLVGWELTERY